MPKDDFRSKFAAARKKGQKTFTYNGKRYTTQTAAEKAKTMSNKQLQSAADKAYTKAKLSGGSGKNGLFKSKSHNEISESYTREQQYQVVPLLFPNSIIIWER